MTKLFIVLGTRPEAIKLASAIPANTPTCLRDRIVGDGEAALGDGWPVGSEARDV